jgi:hypothetical protein
MWTRYCVTGAPESCIATLQVSVNQGSDYGVGLVPANAVRRSRHWAYRFPKWAVIRPSDNGRAKRTLAETLMSAAGAAGDDGALPTLVGKHHRAHRDAAEQKNGAPLPARRGHFDGPQAAFR